MAQLDSHSGELFQSIIELLEHKIATPIVNA